MLKKLLSLPELNAEAKKFIEKNQEVWDIVIYGSVSRGKEDARDIDFAILLASQLDMGKKLKLAQVFKEKIEEILASIQVDVKVVDLYDFQDPNFLARQGILAEGFSLSKGEYLSRLLGFNSYAFIKYSLKGLTYSQKKMLYYALKGRRGTKGVLIDLSGELVSREWLKVPVQFLYKIEQLLALHRVSYSTELALSYWKR